MTSLFQLLLATFYLTCLVVLIADFLAILVG